MHLIDRVDDGKSPDGPLNPEVIAIQFYVEISPVVHDVEAQHASLSCKLGCRDPELVTGRPQVNQCSNKPLPIVSRRAPVFPPGIPASG